ncbi:MAG TPA: hypothetical protein VGM90_24960 [Kofleriaceae bacterium]
MARLARRRKLSRRPFVRRRVLKRAALILALLASGCSSVLGFEDFSTGTDGGSGSNGPKIRLTGKVTDASNNAISDVGVEAYALDGTMISPQINTNGLGTYALDLTLANGSVDGFLHFSTGGFYDAYVEFPGPLSANRTFDTALMNATDVQNLHNAVGLPATQNTGTMLVDTVTLGQSVQIEFGNVRYYDGTGMLNSSVTSASSFPAAVVLDIPDGIYHPHRNTKPAGRAYAVEPNTVVYVTLE